MARTALDMEILEGLVAAPRPVPTLIGQHPRATVYRRVAKLRAEGLIAPSRRGYTLTSVGHRVLADHEVRVFRNGLRDVYPPLGEVPTPQHVALLELIFAAVALRQHTEQDDRHAGFLIVGPTLGWKSSAAEFLALALGVDGASHITDMRTERGQSLWIRRSAAGEVLTRRDLLSAPIVVFDEYQAADAGVRRAVAPFLTGRRRLPMENDIVTVAPVPVVTMNPAPGTTLTSRTTFSEAQLRRMIPLDVTAVEMPDLALTGRNAIVTARQASSLKIPVPRSSADSWREVVVELLRETLTPEGVRLVDVEVVLGLGRGMSAWFPVIVALRQALYNLHLVAETVGWVKPGWVERVRSFPHGAAGHLGVPPAASTRQPQTESRESHMISLFPERPGSVQEDDQPLKTHETVMPTFVLSEARKADLVYIARDSDRSVDEAVALLTKQYRLMRFEEGDTLQDLRAIVDLRDACAEAKVSVAELRECLEFKAALTQQGLSIHEIRDAVDLGTRLEASDVDWDQVRGVAEMMAKLRAAGIDVSAPEALQAAIIQYERLGYDVERLTHLSALYERLEAAGITAEAVAQHVDHLDALRTLGLDQKTAAALAAALHDAGISEDNRAATLQRVIDIGCTENDRLRLEQDRARVARELNALRAAVLDGQKAHADIKTEIVDATGQRDQLREDISVLHEEGAQFYDAILSAEALEQFLLRHTARNDRFWATLEHLLTVKRNSPALPQSTFDWLTAKMQEQVAAFLQQLARRGAPGVAPKTAPGDRSIVPGGGS